MKILAAILLMIFAVQDKPVQSPLAQSSEQKEEKPKPVVLPEAKPVQLRITDGSAPILETARPTATQILSQHTQTFRVTLSAEQIQQLMTEKRAQTSSVNPGIVVENGAVYIKTASFTIPMSGGGASGCWGEASRGKITFHDDVLQRLMESEKNTIPAKKE
jgi:hypothetical protein